MLYLQLKKHIFTTTFENFCRFPNMYKVKHVSNFLYSGEHTAIDLIKVEQVQAIIGPLREWKLTS